MKMRIFDDNELEREATIKRYLIVQSEGNRQVRREVAHYNLHAIIAVGVKIENERAVQFRKWANHIVKDYAIQGWTMDVERLEKSELLQKMEIIEYYNELCNIMKLLGITICFLIQNVIMKYLNMNFSKN